MEAFKEEPANADIPMCWPTAGNGKLPPGHPWFERRLPLDTHQPYWIYEMSLLYFSLNDEKMRLRYMEEAGRQGMRKDKLITWRTWEMPTSMPESSKKGWLSPGRAQKRKPSDISLLNPSPKPTISKGKYDTWPLDHWGPDLEADKQNASALYTIGMGFQKKRRQDQGQQLYTRRSKWTPVFSTLPEKQLPGL